MQQRKTSGASAGDEIVVSSHAVGQAQRVGEILEVLGVEERPHFRVRWEDGHESILHPSSDATIRPRTKTKAKAAR